MSQGTWVVQNDLPPLSELVPEPQAPQALHERIPNPERPIPTPPTPNGNHAFAACVPTMPTSSPPPKSSSNAMGRTELTNEGRSTDLLSLHP